MPVFRIILSEISLGIQWDIQHHSKIKEKYSKYIMGQVRIKISCLQLGRSVTVAHIDDIQEWNWY